MRFVLPLTEEKVKPHQVTALHLLCATAYIGAGAIFFRYIERIQWWGLALLLMGIALAITVITRNKWIVQQKVTRMFRVFELLVLLCLAAYSAMQQWKVPMGMFGVLSAAVLFGIYWENADGNKLNVTLNETGAKLPLTSRRRSIAWWEIEKVIYRYNVLTIDCTNNQLYQWDIETIDFDTEIFEGWCNKMIEDNIEKRVKNDW